MRPCLANIAPKCCIQLSAIWSSSMVRQHFELSLTSPRCVLQELSREVSLPRCAGLGCRQAAWQAPWANKDNCLPGAQEVRYACLRLSSAYRMSFTMRLCLPRDHSGLCCSSR